FQAEDGIRDFHVTGVQTCALPISPTATVEMRLAAMTHDIERMFPGGPRLDHAATVWDDPFYLYPHSLRSAEAVGVWLGGLGAPRSEERRVGKEGRARRSAHHVKTE